MVENEVKGLVRMGVCRRDGSHKSNSPFHAVSGVPWIVRIATAMVVGVNKGFDNTHNFNSILEASCKGLSDEVVKKMASSRADCSIPPSSDDEHAKKRTFVVV